MDNYRIPIDSRKEIVMSDFSKFKEIIDKIINLPRIDDVDERSADDYANDTDNKSLVFIRCLRLISQLIINLVVDLKIVKPGNKISVAVNSAILNCNDKSINALLNIIYNEVNRKPEDLNDYIYQKHAKVICKQIKMILDYIIADSSILNDIIKEVSSMLPSIRWGISTLQTGKNPNNNGVIYPHVLQTGKNIDKNEVK